MKYATLALLAAVCLFVSGCSTATKNALKQDAVAIATQGAQPVAQQLTFNALTKAAVKSPSSTTAAAQALVTICNNDLIPYFKGQPVLAASALQDLLNTKLSAAIPPAVDSGLSFVTSVSSIVDAIKIPSDSNITPTEVTIIVNGLTGISAGAQQYLSSLPPPAPAGATVSLPAGQ